MRDRTMIYLEREQLQALRAEARTKGVSLAELLRRIVARHLEEAHTPPQAPPAAYQKIVAMGSSGIPYVGEEHDRYLGEALRREHPR